MKKKALYLFIAAGIIAILGVLPTTISSAQAQEPAQDPSLFKDKYKVTSLEKCPAWMPADQWKDFQSWLKELEDKQAAEFAAQDKEIAQAENASPPDNKGLASKYLEAATHLYIFGHRQRAGMYYHKLMDLASRVTDVDEFIFISESINWFTHMSVGSILHRPSLGVLLQEHMLKLEMSKGKTIPDIVVARTETELGQCYFSNSQWAEAVKHFEVATPIFAKHQNAKNRYEATHDWMLVNQYRAYRYLDQDDKAKKFAHYVRCHFKKKDLGFFNSELRSINFEVKDPYPFSGDLIQD